MKVQIEHKALLSALRLVSGMAGRSIDKTKDLVRIFVCDEALELATTDLVAARFVRVPSHVDEPGMAVVNCESLLQFLRHSTGEISTISLEGELLCVRDDHAAVSLRVASLDAYPIQPDPWEVQSTIAVDAATLSDALGMLKFVPDPNDPRTGLRGVYAEPLDDGHVAWVATDGVRMSIVEIPVEGDWSATLIPVSSLQSVARIARRRGKVLIGLDRDRVVFRTDGAAVLTQLIVSSYPEYRSLIPQNLQLTLEIYGDDLRGAAKVLYPIARADDDVTLVTLSSDGDRLQLLLETEIAGSKAMLPARTMGTFVTRLQWRYFWDFVNCLPPNSRVEMLICNERSESSPVVFRLVGDDGLRFVHLIMPVVTTRLQR